MHLKQSHVCRFYSYIQLQLTLYNRYQHALLQHAARTFIVQKKIKKSARSIALFHPECDWTAVWGKKKALFLRKKHLTSTLTLSESRHWLIYSWKCQTLQTKWNKANKRRYDFISQIISAVLHMKFTPSWKRQHRKIHGSSR